MGNWNFADIWEAVADGVAQHLIDAGLERQQAVAQYLYNCNEYVESMYAAFKGPFAPVNTNYRYTADGPMPVSSPTRVRSSP
jgi:3-oxocholest-4-en-26-oate---CoA ligase